MSAQNSSHLNEQLLLAVQRTNVEIVRDLLAAGADPNAREPLYTKSEHGAWASYSERTALMRAAQSSYADQMIAVLLAAGADVHATDTQGRGALLAASGHRWSQVVRLLLAAGAVATPETTPRFLSSAAGSSDPEMVRFALDAGFNANGESGKGQPLVRAVRSLPFGPFEPPPSEALKCVEMLIEAGASVEARDQTDCPILVGAVGSREFPILQALLRAGARPDARDAHQMTASLWLAGHSSDARIAVPLLKLLFEHGARFDVANKEGCPLLHYAAGGLDETGTLCRLVVEAGARVESRDPQGQTALMSAAKRGRSAAIRVLLKAGAELEARDVKGWTALMHAVWIAPRMMHEANILPPPTHLAWRTSAGVEMRDAAERNRKQRAAMRGAAQTLLDAGADPLAQTDDGQTVLQLAASDPSDGALQLIQNALSING